jgi:hypothetical protein
LEYDWRAALRLEMNVEKRRASVKLRKTKRYR